MRLVNSALPTNSGVRAAARPSHACQPTLTGSGLKVLASCCGASAADASAELSHHRAASHGSHRPACRSCEEACTSASYVTSCVRDRYIPAVRAQRQSCCAGCLGLYGAEAVCSEENAHEQWVGDGLAARCWRWLCFLREGCARCGTLAWSPSNLRAGKGHAWYVLALRPVRSIIRRCRERERERERERDEALQSGNGLGLPSQRGSLNPKPPLPLLLQAQRALAGWAGQARWCRAGLRMVCVVVECPEAASAAGLSHTCSKLVCRACSESSCKCRQA